MNVMQLDHLSYAAGPDGLDATAERLSRILGEEFLDGGIHPRFGTSNVILPLTGGSYLEVVAVLDHPASDKAPFGQAVRARTMAGGGWLAWVIRVDDIEVVEKRLERKAVLGNRHRPDGVELIWRQIGVLALRTDPQFPFFIEWDMPEEEHPSYRASGNVALSSIELAGDPTRLRSWLDEPVETSVAGCSLEWVSGFPPGVVAASFLTRDGIVRI